MYLIFSGYFAAEGLIYPFWPTWLASLGFGASQIGLLIAAAYWPQVIAGVALTYVADWRIDQLRLATLLAALLAWWIPALPGRRGLLALASTLALGAGLYAAWDDRWQAGVGAFAGFSLLLGACLRRKPERGLPFRTGSLYGLLVLLAIAALYLFPVAPLPAPSGPYAVGVRDFELDDPSRPGLLGTPAGQPRRLLVRAWYPARPIAGAAPRHYFDPGEARSTARGFGEILGFPPLLTYLKHLRTNSYPDAPLRDDSARLPVVFYSHGYSAFAGGNWTLMRR